MGLLVVQRLGLPKRFDNYFIARLAQVTENSVIPLTKTWPTLPTLPSPPPPLKTWTRPDPEPKSYYVQNNAFLHPSLPAAWRRQQAPWIPWMTPWPHKSMPYISLRLPGLARSDTHSRPGVCCHYCKTITSFCFSLSKTFIVSIFWRPSFVHDSNA